MSEEKRIYHHVACDKEGCLGECVGGPLDPEDRKKPEDHDQTRAEAPKPILTISLCKDHDTCTYEGQCPGRFKFYPSCYKRPEQPCEVLPAGCFCETCQKRMGPCFIHIQRNDNPSQINAAVMPSASLQGRSEALQIILNLEAECGLDEYIEGHAEGDNGDHSSYWDVAGLKKLFHVGDEYENSPGCKIAEAADSMYWELISKSDDMNTFKGLVRDILAQIEVGKINKGPWCTVNLLKTWID